MVIATVLTLIARIKFLFMHFIIQFQIKIFEEMPFVLSLALLFVASFLYVISIFRIPSFRTYKLAQKIPGPNKLWIFGVAMDVWNKDSKTLLPYFKNEIVNKHPGPVCRLWMIGIPVILVVDPEFVKDTLGKSNNVKKGFEYDALKSGVGNGLVAVDVSKWKERRKLLAPLFNNKAILGQMFSMNKHARIMVDRLKAHHGEPVDIFAYSSLGILQLLLESMMEVEMSDVEHIKEFMYSFHRVTNTIIDRIVQVYLKDWMYLFTKSGKFINFFKKKMYNFTDRVIKQRRSFHEKKIHIELDDENIGGRKKSFLDVLLKSDHKNQLYCTESDIRDEATTFMLAGHDSTAVTIQFVLFHLALDKEIQEKAYEEQYAIFGDSDRDVTENDILEMNYLTQVIQESLRLYPPLPYISRELEEDTVCGEIVLPKGSNVVTSPYIIHRQENLYPNPEKFDPDRFSTEEIEKRHPYAYIPFGAGKRYCIAKNMAMMNLKVFLATIIRQFKMEKGTELDEVELELLIFLSSSNPIFIKFLPRN